MTENRFVLLVYVKCSRNCYFNCNDRAGFPDMNYEKLDQILWKCQQIILLCQILAEIYIEGD